MFYLVYKTTNLINGKFYIGIHKQLGEEFDGYYGSGLLLVKAIAKYGKENFLRETLFTYDTLTLARDKERELVTEDFCKLDTNYNLSVGGTGGNTTAGLSEEQKALVFSKRKETNEARGNYVYTGEKYLKAKARMLAARIQPDNKGRLYNEVILQAARERGFQSRGKFIWVTNGELTMNIS